MNELYEICSQSIQVTKELIKRVLFPDTHEENEGKAKRIYLDCSVDIER